MALHLILSGLGSLLTLKVSLICLVLSTALYIINALFFRVPSPKGVPLIRESRGKTSFSWKTRLAYYTDCESLYREAYQNYSKKGKAVIIPGFGARHEIILPVSSIRWVTTQPETVLSPGDGFAEVDQVAYSLGHEKYVVDDWQGHLVKTELNLVLENIVAALNDELGVAFKHYFGINENEWKAVDLLETIRMVVAQAAGRFTVGLPLCRNEQYLRDSFDAIDGCIINAGITGGTPPILRPLVGKLAGLKTQLAQRKVKKHFEPLYRARLETLKYAKNDPEHAEPQDHLQMMLRFAQKERPHELYDLDIMARRLTAANFGSMHQTSIQVTNMLLNILGSDTEYNTIATLRDEVSQAMGGNDTEWTKAKVSKMIKADSAARETLRCHSFGGRALFRKVMTDGVETDTGIQLPKGSLISFFSQPVHADDDVYEEPLKYDPFRFSRAREEAASSSTKDNSNTNKLSFVSTSPDYLPFGHGKHACPGRFLIDFELKMIIAYVLMNYDVRFPEEYGGKRPENRWLAEAFVPPDGAKILVKRRKGTASKTL